jgi:sensor histidine kinase YesM
MSSRKTKFRQYFVVILISLVGSIITTYFSCPNCSSNLIKYLWVTFFSTCLWVSLWIGNGELPDLINRWISWVEFPVRRLIVGIIATVVYTVSVVLLITRFWEFFLNFSFDSYYEVVLPSLVITFFISAILHGREFLILWRKSAIDAERLQKESITAQYNSLKSQVNPHFLFNSLNALTNLVYEDQDKAVKFIKQLSEVYRYVLDTQSKEIVPLKEELEFLNSYLFLQKIRFGENLTIDVNLSTTPSMVAPLALQLLIENAIKHNIVSAENPLIIKVWQQQNFIVVENSLQRKTSIGEPSQGIGLENIKSRYKFLSQHPVEVREEDGKFIVKLPLIAVE